MTARNTAKKATQKAAPKETAPTDPEKNTADPAPTAPEKPAADPAPASPADPAPTAPEQPAAEMPPAEAPSGAAAPAEVPAASPAPAEAQPSPWSEATVATGDAPGLNLRGEKSTEGVPVGSLPNGMAVLAGPDEDGWREVKGAGWVLSEFLA